MSHSKNSFQNAARCKKYCIAVVFGGDLIQMKLLFVQLLVIKPM